MYFFLYRAVYFAFFVDKSTSKRVDFNENSVKYFSYSAVYTPKTFQRLCSQIVTFRIYATNKILSSVVYNLWLTCKPEDNALMTVVKYWVIIYNIRSLTNFPLMFHGLYNGNVSCIIDIDLSFRIISMPNNIIFHNWTQCFQSVSLKDVSIFKSKLFAGKIKHENIDGDVWISARCNFCITGRFEMEYIILTDSNTLDHGILNIYFILLKAIKQTIMISDNQILFFYDILMYLSWQQLGGTVNELKYLMISHETTL